jgi:hypothetical protein
LNQVLLRKEALDKKDGEVVIIVNNVQLDLLRRAQIWQKQTTEMLNI